MKGTFRARAIQGDLGTAGTGTGQVGVIIELEGGERRTWYGYFSDAAVDRTLESLTIMGVTDLETFAGLGSTEFEAVIDEEEYQGKTREKVKFINRLGSGGVAMKTRMSEAEKHSFAQRFKGKFLNVQRQHAAPAASSAAPPAPDDDIPF